MKGHEMEIVCLIVNGLIALAALVLVWRKLQSDPELVRGMIKTVASAFNAGLASSVKQKRAEIDMAEMEIRNIFQPTEPETGPLPERVDGEVGLDDGKPEDSA